MKHVNFLFLIIVATLLFALPVRVNSQGAGINTISPGAAPDPSAAFDLTSSTKGLLVPGLTNTQRGNILSPATGLIIYNITTSKFNYFNGTSWVELEINVIANSVNMSANNGLGMGIGGTNDPSAILHLTAVNGNAGLLIPRMADPAIISTTCSCTPATGLLIYNTTQNLLEYFDGSMWQFICGGISLGTTQLTGTNIPGENVAANTTGAVADPSSVLDINSTVSGFLMPRLSVAQRNTLPSPTNGLVIFNTGTNTFNYFNGSTWLEISPVLNASISYPSSPFCNTLGPQNVTLFGPSGGTYSSTAGLTIDASTGAINPISSSIGTYTVSYTASAICASTTVTTTVSVVGNLTSSVSGGTSPTCYNTDPGILTATGGGGTGTYAYLWYANGISTGVTTQTYDPGNLTATSTFYCAITSGSCGSVNSATTTITVNPLPSVPTAATNTITTTQVAWNWNTSSDATGYKYNTVNNYATAVDNGSSTTYIQTGLTCATSYTLYVWAYNACGNSAAVTLTQSTSPCGPPACGSQTWASGFVNSGSFELSSTFGNQTIGNKWCLNDVAANCAAYGEGLYDWRNAMGGGSYSNTASNPPTIICNPCGPTTGNGGVQGICPAGYHVPSDYEMSQYEYCVYSSIAPIGNTTLHDLNYFLYTSSVGFRGGDAGILGTKLKGGPVAANSFWDGNNASGFGALMGGYCQGNGFWNVGGVATWWTATESTTFPASSSMFRLLQLTFSGSYDSYNTKTWGFGVRCLKD